MNRIEFFCQQMLTTRDYTLKVLEHTPRQKWFEMPMGMSHVAWHVGHLAFAQYAHFVMMICGEGPEDTAAFAKERYFGLFGKGTSPRPDSSLYPSPEQMLRDMAALQVHCLSRLRGLSEDQLDTMTLLPHQIARTRFEMAMWWIKHEMLHVGQISLLRRLLGESPWR